MSDVGLPRSLLNSGAALTQRDFRLSFTPHLLRTNAAIFPSYYQFSLSRTSCPIVATPRNLPGFLEPLFERNISVFCSQEPASGPGENWVPQEDSNFRDGETGNGVSNDGDSSPSQQLPMWDLQSRHKRLQAIIAAQSADPLQDSMSTAGRKLQNYLDGHRIFNSKEIPQLEWDWERWRDHFTAVEEQENLASALKFQLEDSVENERYEEAARLKTALRAATADDPVSEVFNELENAVKNEKYEQAAKLRDDAAVGLVGWWMALAEDGSDPYGGIVNIAAGHGKYVAVGYTARQLTSASAGTPLFEVFIRNDSEGYHQQAVYLLPVERSRNLVSKTTKSSDINIENVTALVEEVSEAVKLKYQLEALQDEKEKSVDATSMDEGLRHLIDFLKERIPNMDLKILKLTTPDTKGIPKMVEQLFDEVVSQDGDAIYQHKESEVPVENGPHEVDDRFGESRDVAEEDKEETFSRFIAGGMLQSSPEESLPKVPTRVRARIEYQSQDSFSFHIEGDMAQQIPVKESLSPRKAIRISTQNSADVPPDATKIVWNLEKVPVKMSKEVAEFLNLAMIEAPHSYCLSKFTCFERIKPMNTLNDPLHGLYIGAFGPYTLEVIQLRERYGCWNGEQDLSNNKDRIDFFRYVEAIKLTGDLNVPAGQITFRAKTGRENRLSCHGVYPEELGVIARYGGQGRLAEPGFKNPAWVDGELLLFDEKQGIGATTGAVLGFVYILPEQHLLVLFNRLNLQV